MRSYRPDELFDADGTLVDELRRSRRAAIRRMSANPHANGGPCCATSRCPAFARLCRRRSRAGAVDAEATRVARPLPARRHRCEPARTSACSARTRRRRTGSTRSSRSPIATFVGEIARRSTTTSRARRPRDGNAQRAPLSGLARRLPAHRPARLLLVLRSVRAHRRLDVQPAREVAGESIEPHPVAPADRVAELPAHLARVAPGPQRLQPPGSGLHGPRRQQEGRSRARLPAARCQHAALASPTTACAARNYVNVIVAGKQPELAVARHATPRSCTAPRGSGSGAGPATTKAANPTS